MEGSTITIVLGVAGFLLNIVVLTGAGVWFLSRMEARLSRDVNKNRDDIHAELDQMRREVGEAIAAIRQKVTDDAMWSRDTFIRRETFFELMRRGESLMDVRFKAIDTQFEKFDVRFSKIEDKIDIIKANRQD